MKKGRRRMIWILCTIAVLVIAVTIFFLIPFSPIRNEFQRDVQQHIALSSSMHSGIFTQENIAFLPEPVQNHLRATGLISQPIPNSVRAFMPSAPLYQSRDSSPLHLDFTLYLFAHPARLAYMRASMFGIPFEAFDSTQDGAGFMRGVIGKVVPLFNQTGPEMDRGQILTWLGEAPLLPSSLLSEHITWESIDASHVRATVNYREMTVSGIFSFNENGFFRSFRTTERARIGTDGSIEFPAWSVVFDEWIQDANGKYVPYAVRVIWHLDDGDFVYFSSSGFDVVFH